MAAVDPADGYAQMGQGSGVSDADPRELHVDASEDSAASASQTDADGESGPCHCLADDDPENLEPYEPLQFEDLKPDLCNDLRHICLHLHRNLLIEGISTREVISPLERKVVEKHKDAVNKEMPPESVLNFLAWRRSAMFFVIIPGIVYLAVQIWTLIGTILAHNFFGTWAGDGHITFNEYAKLYPPPEAGDFVSYSFHQLRSLIGSVLEAACTTAIVEESALLIFTIGALACVIYARLNWWRHSTSRRWLQTGWVLAFLAPMLISITPTRNFIRYDAGSYPVIEGYISEVAELMNLNEAQRSVLGTCDKVSSGLMQEQMEGVVRTINAICTQINKMPVSFSVPCKKGLCTVDFKGLVGTCEYIQGVVDSGGHQDAHAFLAQLCGKLDTLFPDGGPGDEFSKLLSFLQSPLLGVVPAVETLSIMICALHSLKCTLPSALIIAPGLLRGAIRAKAILPAAAEPGMLAMITPWFFAAALWSAYAILFRFIRSYPLIIGLTAIAFGPMTIFAVGEAEGIHRPMDDNNFIVSYRRLRKRSCLVYGFGFFFTIWGLIETIPPLIGHPPPAIKPAIRALLCPQMFASAFVGMFFLFGLTSVGATDWIVVQIAVQRKAWMEHAGLYHPDHSDDEHHVHSLFDERDKHLAAVLAKTEGRMDDFATTFHDMPNNKYGQILESAAEDA